MWHPFKRLRIDILLFGCFALVISLLLAVGGWGAYYLSSQQLVKNTTVYQQQILTELNNQLEILCRSIEQASLSISRDSNLQDYLTIRNDNFTKYSQQNIVVQKLRELINSYPNIYSIQIYEANPLVTNESNDVAMLKESQMQKEPWFESVKNSDSVWISERQVETVSGRTPVISFFRRVYSTDMSSIGIVVLNVRLEAFESVLQRSESRELLLLDGGNRPMTKKSIERLTAELEDLIPSLEGDKGFIPITRVKNKDRVSPLKEKSLIVWSRSFKDSWMLVEVTPWQTITANSLRLALTLFTLGLFTLLPALLIALYFSRHFTKPIRYVVNSMVNFNLQTPKHPLLELPSGYTNEFGSLLRGYHKLEERINELYTQQQQELTKQKEVELKALQANINPHFLYNTLDQLNWMAIDADQAKMSRVIELMGKMFRVTLSNGESWISLEAELEHMNSYLEIQQQVRLDERLKVEWAIDPECLALYVPKLTLQPLVENAIIHGFHGRNDGLLRLSAVKDTDTLVLSVTDNGVGLSNDWKERRKRKTGGYGIRNIEERLEAYFGSDYGLQAEKLLTGGTQVTIKLPVLQEKPV
ncbi:cache domain-containing sensor histidine kinase [Paenibacillus agricola]|uniref:Sensor histidine kinase n=1 Tax=Paenibacillus agricola TaxID=2716264 RepID=A0ABX0JLK3_9BACL|nr:sensor histidine kinase [Paenibacillus agricola]NHN34905.1 sensor histidine kinase [Paenibacillus agricola]